jgi:GTPase SAR1 family protein
MTGPAETARWLDAVLALLDRPRPIAVDPGRIEELAGRADRLRTRVRGADDRVAVGLIGGTGVGKSTLINALAGQSISTGSELRPTTSRVVIYRHRDNDFSLAAEEDVHVHQSPALARVSLADFPDFDSIEPDHRQALARHFPRLDLLLWVVDPVKYADESLFRWLELSPQAKANSLFVFNKIDEFRRRYPDRADEVQAEVVADFQDKLYQYGGLDDPEVLALSALDAVSDAGPGGGPGLQKLNQRLETLRERKRRLAVKAMNLTAMVERLKKDLKDAARPDSAQRGLNHLRSAVADGRKSAANLARSESVRLTAVLGPAYQEALAGPARRRAPWPLDFFLFVWHGLTGLLRRSKPAERARTWPEPDLEALQRRLSSWLEAFRSAFEPGSPADRALEAHLSQRADQTSVADAGAQALADGADRRSRRLARRFHWRVRQHLLPALVLIYPFTPYFFSLVAGGDAPRIELAVSWRDLWPLIQVVVGLYVVETIYWAYRLDRAARRALDQLVAEWAKGLEEQIDRNLFQPADDFADRLADELGALHDLGIGPERGAA